MKDRLPHLLFQHSARTATYTPPNTGGGSKFKLKPRDRQQHATALLDDLRQIAGQESATVAAQQALGRDAGNGLYLQFESDPGFELAFESLEFRSSSIELLAVVENQGRMLASVYVPEGKLGIFIKKVEAYLTQESVSKKGIAKPRNKNLVESIAHIRLAALNGLWTDSPELFPQDDRPLWWEVWLRCGAGFDEVGFFRAHAPHLGVRVADDEVRFLERCVLLVFADRSQMARSIHLLLGIAELRRAKESAAFFSNMGNVDQQPWVQSAAAQLVPPDALAPSVCILDTGVNHQHPLLAPFIHEDDRDAVDPRWDKADHHPQGHGTNVAGLALFGDLSDRLGQPLFEPPRHRVESVKVLPPDGANERRLYGWVYSEAMQRATIFAADRPRVFCSTVTTADGREQGKPSSWSAMLDKLASGMEDGESRLIVQCAGNLGPEFRGHNDYPSANETDPIHDPGQAWNVLTIGYYTDKWRIDEEGYAGYRPIAEPGGLGPTSCTALVWPDKGRQKWPNKPDVVFEGGNWAVNPADNFPGELDSLQLLTTGHQHLNKPLVTFGETSAATALAARFAARLMLHYPTLWPETLRGLIVHSARWTDTMRRSIPAKAKKSEWRRLLRTVGYGVPEMNEALWSASNSLTLIVQDEMQPFTENGKKEIKPRDIHYHDLPWPADVLRGLPPTTPVEMRVTLSYFIQPNPGERGWSGRFSYASHGLRFRVRAPGESRTEFERRINAAAQDEEFERTGVSDSDHWDIGSDTRELGSLHSDYWHGSAQELADCGYMAVYPVMGWWRSRKALERWHLKARYALIVTIRTPEQSADVYTPVANLINLPVMM